MKLTLDSPVLDYVNTLLSYIVLNLLFILCCIPVITIGPAVAALYAVMLREARREYGYLYRSFLRAFREMFFQALGMSLFFVAFVLFISFSMVFWSSYGGALPMAASVLLAVLMLVTLGAGLYGFPLLARFQNTVRQTVRNAFGMTVAHAGYTVLLIGIEAAAAALFYFFPLFRVFMLAVGFVFVALCKSLILSVVFARYESKKE